MISINDISENEYNPNYQPYLNALKERLVIDT